MAVKVVFEEVGGPDVLKIVPDSPTAPGPNEIQVKNKSIGVNMIETYFRRGVYKTPLPSGIGQEGAGVVEAVGSNVTDFKPGDRVTYLSTGSYREYINVPADRAVPIPDHVSDDEAVAVLLKGLTAWYLLRKLAYVPEKGEVVVLHAAAGGVGLIFLQWAYHLGIKVIALASTAEKLKLAKSYGAWETVNYRENKEWSKRVAELTDGKKVRIVYDSVGKDTFYDSLDSLAPHGLLVSYGNASGVVPPIDIGILNAKGSLYVTRPGLFSYVSTAEELRKAAHELFELVGTHIKVKISRTFPLSKAIEAHEIIESRASTGSMVLHPDST